MASFIYFIFSKCYLLADDFFDIGESCLFKAMLLDERFDLRINVVAVIDGQ